MTSPDNTSAAFGKAGHDTNSYQYDPQSWRNHSPLSLYGRVVSESLSAYNKSANDPRYVEKSARHLLNARNYLDLLELHALAMQEGRAIKPLDWDKSPIPEELYFLGSNGSVITADDLGQMLGNAVHIMSDCIERIEQTRPEVIKEYNALLSDQPKPTWKAELA